jgi:hypothetical protein
MMRERMGKTRENFYATVEKCGLDPAQFRFMHWAEDFEDPTLDIAAERKEGEKLVAFGLRTRNMFDRFDIEDYLYLPTPSAVRYAKDPALYAEVVSEALGL